MWWHVKHVVNVVAVAGCRCCWYWYWCCCCPIDIFEIGQKDEWSKGSYLFKLNAFHYSTPTPSLSSFPSVSVCHSFVLPLFFYACLLCPIPGSPDSNPCTHSIIKYRYRPQQLQLRVDVSVHVLLYLCEYSMQSLQRICEFEVTKCKKKLKWNKILSPFSVGQLSSSTKNIINPTGESNF